jgi:hypothetical protein
MRSLQAAPEMVSTLVNLDKPTTYCCICLMIAQDGLSTFKNHLQEEMYVARGRGYCKTLYINFCRHLASKLIISLVNIMKLKL